MFSVYKVHIIKKKYIGMFIGYLLPHSKEVLCLIRPRWLRVDCSTIFIYFTLYFFYKSVDIRNISVIPLCKYLSYLYIGDGNNGLIFLCITKSGKIDRTLLNIDLVCSQNIISYLPDVT